MVLGHNLTPCGTDEKNGTAAIIYHVSAPGRVT